MTTADTANTVTRYRKESWRLLAQVDVELERGELEQASQALWDAAAQGLKAAAAGRGWPHDTVNDLMKMIVRLIQEEGASIELNTNAIMAHAFNRRERAWIMPIGEPGVRYVQGPVSELLKTLERMD